MKLRLIALVSVLFMASGVPAQSQVYEEVTTRLEPVVVTGELVRLEPGKTIVIRSRGEEISYVIGPGVAVPAEVEIGRSISVLVEPGPGGSSLVKRVTTTTVDSEGQVKRTTEVTRTRPSGETATTTATARTVTGAVVQLEAGKTIVIRSDGKETRYVLSPGVSLPAEIQVGRSATLQFEPGADGTSLVKRITTTTVSPEGQMKQTTEITRTNPAGVTSRTTVSILSGTVESYVPGKSVTVLDSKGTRVTYLLSAESQVPSEVVLGREVMIHVAPTEHGARVLYEIQRDGNTIKIRAKTKPQS